MDYAVNRAADGRLMVWNLSGRSDGSYPYMTGEIGTELEYNSYFAASNSEYERDNWLTNIHLEQELHLDERMSVRSNVRVVLESDGEDDRFYSDFPNEGVYLIELLAKYQTEHFSVFGGKYEPAAHIRGYAPIFFGNYSRNLVLDRRLGGGASVTVGNDTVGRHTLTGHLFRMDTTRLRGEIISDEWRQDEFIDMAGDIGWPSSYLVTLQGGPPTDDVSLSYTLGAGEQTRGDRPDERMLIGALFGRVPIEGLGSVEASIDALHLNNAAGYREDRKVLESGIGVNTSAFYVGGAYSFRHADPAEDPARVDHIAELVGRYYLSQRSTVEAAYQHVREAGDVENAVGIAIRYWADWLVH